MAYKTACAAERIAGRQDKGILSVSRIRQQRDFRSKIADQDVGRYPLIWMIGSVPAT